MGKRYQRRVTELTAEQVADLVKNAERVSKQDLQGPYTPPFTEYFVGKKLTVKLDCGKILNYTFSTDHDMTWQENDAEVMNEHYDAMEADDGIYLLHHLRSGVKPCSSTQLVIDTTTGIVTACYAKIGQPGYSREVSHVFYSGYIVSDEKEAPLERHHRTQDLIGKRVQWIYTSDFSCEHFYISDTYYSYLVHDGVFKGFGETNPADYFKVNAHIYFFTWIEERAAGVQGFCLMDLAKMHDVGCFFGLNYDDEFENYMFGAKGIPGPGGVCVGVTSESDVED